MLHRNVLIFGDTLITGGGVVSAAAGYAGTLDWAQDFDGALGPMQPMLGQVLRCVEGANLLAG
jgi:hypothetical protein